MTNTNDNFNYLTADRAYNTFFLQLPKPFITSPKYKHLSSNAKIAYTLLRDRSEYSLLKNLVDEKGRIFFLFTDDELADDLSVSRNTARKTKQELIEANLLKKVDMGFNKKENKRNASRHYLAELEVSASDVYPLEEKHRKNLDNAKNTDIEHGANFEHSDTTHSANFEHRVSDNKSAKNTDIEHGANFEHSDTTHSANFEHRVSDNKSAKNTDIEHGANFEHSDTTHSANFEQELDRTINNKDSKDSKDLADEQLDLMNQSINQSNQDKEIQNDLINHYISDNYLNEQFGNAVVSNMKKYSNSNFKTFEIYVSKLIHSLKTVEKKQDITLNTFDYDYLHEQLNTAFNRVLYLEKQGKVKNINDYLFITFRNLFESYAESEQQSNTDSNVPMDNWLENTGNE